MCHHVPVLAAITIRNLPAGQLNHAVELQSSLHFSERLNIYCKYFVITVRKLKNSKFYSLVFFCEQ